MAGVEPIVILVGTSHPGNAGAAARAAANFGVHEMRLVAPRGPVQGKEAIDRAVHAKPLLASARVYEDLASALDGISFTVGTTARTSPAAHHFRRKPLDVRDWCDELAKTGFSGKVALVFGREDFGLSNEEVNLCDLLVTIPTADYNSLNLSHAVSLLCYELHRTKAPRTTTPRVLSPGAMTALHRAWDALIEETEDRGWRREVAHGVWRKVIGRSHPDTYEVHNLMGILTRTLKRFGRPEYSTPESDKTLKEQGLYIGPKSGAPKVPAKRRAKATTTRRRKAPK